MLVLFYYTAPGFITHTFLVLALYWGSGIPE